MSKDRVKDKTTQNQEPNINYDELPSELFLEFLERELPESYMKIIKDSEEEEKFFKKLGENIKYLNALEGTSFIFTSEGLRNKDLENTQISKVLIIPLKEQYLISINSIKCNLEIMAIISPSAEILPPIVRTIEEIENGKWMTDPIWWKKIINDASFQKNAQVNCIKELTKNIPVELIYSFTGSTERNNKKIYVLPGGAIGTDEPIKVDLGDAELNRLCLTKKEFDLKACNPLKFLEIAFKKIALLLLALEYKAVISSIFEELGIGMNFITVVTGSKSSEKLNLVLGACNTFGTFDASHLPIKLTDNELEIKEKVAKCRDILIPCTGIASSNRAESNQIAKNFEALIKATVTGVAKSTVIVVADKVPEIFESYRTRVLIINVKDEDINKAEMKQVLEHQEEWQYFMKKFLENLCTNYEEIKLEIKEIFKNKVDEIKENIEPRTAEIIAELYVGYAMLIDFASKNEILTLDEQDKMLNEAWDTLIELAKDQEAIIEEDSLINKALSAIKDLTDAGKLTTVDYNEANAFTEQELMKDGFVGYFNIEKDGTKLALIYPDLLYKEIKNYYNQQGLLFPWNQAEMCKELFAQDYLYKTGKQMRPQIRRYNPRTDKEETFIGLLNDKINIACRFKKRGMILTR